MNILHAWTVNRLVNNPKHIQVIVVRVQGLIFTYLHHKQLIVKNAKIICIKNARLLACDVNQ